jgi:hypothetical protein
VAVVVLFQCAPLAIPWVWTADWPVTVQTVVSGLLTLGIPELGFVIGIALIGKSEVKRIWRITKVLWRRAFR